MADGHVIDRGLPMPDLGPERPTVIYQQSDRQPSDTCAGLEVISGVHTSLLAPKRATALLPSTGHG